jgi:hypothetical protein
MVGRPMRLRNLIVGAMLCASMLFAAPAFAQDAAQSGYSTPAGSIQEQISTQNEPPDSTTTTTAASQPDEGGNLPFTGFDVALIMAAGAVLLGMGIGIRRLSRSEVA